MPYVVGSESEIGKNSLFGDKHTHLYDLRSLFKELRPASLGKSSPDGMKCLPRMGEEILSWVSCSRAIGQEERMRQFLKLKNGGEFLHKGGNAARCGRRGLKRLYKCEKRRTRRERNRRGKIRKRLKRRERGGAFLGEEEEREKCGEIVEKGGTGAVGREKREEGAARKSGFVGFLRGKRAVRKRENTLKSL